jgi:uncharacterized membrane protein YsdA (DUF1294 family)
MPTEISWPLAVAGIYVIMSLVTLFAYGIDKRAAVKSRRRVSEAALHGLELLGGWPGGWLGQRVFRHKTAKRSYRVVFWCIGLLHAGLLVWWGGTSAGGW